MNDDPALLRRYAESRSEEAFAELVQRNLGLVYAAAMRRLGGDAHGAKDVAQVGMTMIDWLAPVTDAAVARAETVLSPAQLAALKQVQAQQVTQIQLAPPPPDSPNESKPGGAK